MTQPAPAGSAAGGRPRATVLVSGATGFIGRRLCHALAEAGYVVVGAVRDPALAATRDPAFRYVRGDFSRDADTAAWRERLHGVDVVVNAAGILRERGAQTFDAVHRRGPAALFAACAAAGVRRVVQISALGADAGAQSAYHRSKKAGDDALAQQPLSWLVVQPSLVYGPGGASATLFTALASMPVVALPGTGDQRIQPLHVADLVDALVAAVGADAESGQRVALVGPEPTTLRGLLRDLRAAMGLGAARWLPVPMIVVRAAARIGSWLPGLLLDRETLRMLERGNVADSGATRRLLGRAPRPPAAFIGGDEAASVAAAARLAWLLPPLRTSLAFVWLLSGVVSLGLYPVAESYALLARAGLHGSAATIALYGAAMLDIGLGVATLLLPRRRMVWLAQAAVIVAYTVIVSVKLPEFWLHPYGPVAKNVPMLAAIWVLYELGKPRWTT